MIRERVIGSPFEQFEIHRIIPIQLGELDLSITNSTIYMIYALVIYTVLYKINVEKGKVVPGRWQIIIEMTFGQIVSLVMENIGDGKYVPFIWTIFINIAIMNLVGLVPYTFTPTAHLIVGFGLSVSIVIGVTVMGLDNYGSNYLAAWMPSGSPIALAPLLVGIELVSHLAKAVSLGARLAANITAGHAILVIISGLGFSLLTAGGASIFLGILPIAILVLVVVLEIGVALIQAYVFSVLTAIYINESIHIH